MLLLLRSKRYSRIEILLQPAAPTRPAGCRSDWQRPLIMDWMTQILVSPPCQILELNPHTVILRRATARMRLTGQGVCQATRIIFDATTGNGTTGADILELFDWKARDNVVSLLEQLMARRFIFAGGEGHFSHEDTSDPNSAAFYWNFGTSTCDVLARLNGIKLLAIGVNYISRQLSHTLADASHYDLPVFDHPLLRNGRFFIGNHLADSGEWPSNLGHPKPWNNFPDAASFDCMIASSDFGSQELLFRCNNYCLQQERIFLPLVLHDGVGYIGPLVIPGETACLECLRARQNSHLSDFAISRQIETASFEAQAAVGFHPSMPSVIGNIAALEITKFFGGIGPCLIIGSMVEVDLLSCEMTTRRVLKVPRCAGCSFLQGMPRVDIKSTGQPIEHKS
jgi:bacteriocin biosynthesis cyclodehydratase domain-containing protein